MIILLALFVMVLLLYLFYMKGSQNTLRKKALIQGRYVFYVPKQGMYALYIKKDWLEILTKSAYAWQIYDTDGMLIKKQDLKFPIIKSKLISTSVLDGYFKLEAGEYYLDIPHIDNPKQKDWQCLIKPLF